MSKVSQKDYLKKYLSSDDKLRKKKKKSKDKTAKSTVKIIDDDEYGYNANDHELDESELFALNEEAPQIVGVIDERAPEVLMKQEYIDSGKWKKIGGSQSKSKPDKHKKQRKRSLSGDPSPPRSGKSPKPIDLTDESPPRRRRKSSDESPPRRQNGQSSSRRSRSPATNSSNKRRDSDASPPRRSRRDSDNSPPRRAGNSTEVSQKRRDSDASPPRRNRKSPEIKRERRNSGDNSPPRRQRRRSNTPPRQRRSRWSPDIKREPESPKRQEESPPRSSRMTKTLDGKVSGLQDAKTLKRENDAFKERQDKQFREMRPEMSGRDAEIVIRDRRGRNKDFEREVEDERKKTEVEEARKKVYSRWGKGVKQIEELEQRYQEHVHEASKPFARMADDEDMRDHLRNQERLDDPMLEYMRKKKQDENKKKGVLERPKYLGQFPDNRFNIRPGYRWDGVDRSNGYEKKFFSVVSSKKSQEEEAYRYSTEDM